MNKALKITLISLGSLIGLILIAMISIPLFFKNQIADMAIKAANDNLNAKIELSGKDIGLSLFRHFPDFTLEVKNLKITGTDNFEGTTLAEVPLARITLNLASVLKGAPKVMEVTVDHPFVNIVYDMNGKANYDIVKPSGEEESVGEEISDSFDLTGSLEKLSIANARIAYTDSLPKTSLTIADASLSGSGDMAASRFELKTEMDVKGISFRNGADKLANNLTLWSNLIFDADMEKMIFAVKSDVPYNIKLNDIELLCKGQIVVKDNDDIDIDLAFGSAQTRFSQLLSLVPENYLKQVDGLKTSGEFSLNGYLKGIYNDTTYPGFGVKLDAKNGFVQYPGLPKSISGITLAAEAVCPQSASAKEFDEVVLNVSKFSMDFGGNPVNADLVLKTPVSDPDFSFNLHADVDLDKVRDVMPLEENEKLSGSIYAAIQAAGRLSMFEKGQYDRVKAAGELKVKNMVYQSPAYPGGVKINSVYLTISPAAAALKEFDVVVGSSDLSMTGSLKNYLGYILKNQTIEGTLAVNSNNLNLDELMPPADMTAQQTPKVAEQKKDTAAMSPVVIPANIRFNTTVSLKKVSYGNIVMTDIAGNLGLRDQIAYLNGIKMNALGGNAAMNGSYNAEKPENAKVDMDLKISRLSLRQIARLMPSISKIAPIIQGAEGNIGGELSLDTRLNAKMEPVISTLNSTGTLTSSDIKLSRGSFVSQLADKLDIKDLKEDPSIKDLNLSYGIKNGILTVHPTKAAIAEMSAVIGGDVNLDKESLNMTADIKLPTKYLGADLNKLLQNAVATANQLGLKASIGETIPISTLISGNMSDPKYSLLYGEEKYASPGDYVKAEVAKMVEKQKDAAISKVKEEASKALGNLLGSSSKKDTTSQGTDAPKNDVENKVNSLLKNLFK